MLTNYAIPFGILLRVSFAPAFAPASGPPLNEGGGETGDTAPADTAPDASGGPGAAGSTDLGADLAGATDGGSSGSSGSEGCAGGPVSDTSLFLFACLALLATCGRRRSTPNGTGENP